MGLSALVSAAIKLTRYRNYRLEVERAEENLDALMSLLEEETAFLSEVLPPAIVRASKGNPEPAVSACVRLLESRGPFFPKVHALETLGLLKADEHVPEILDFLADENSYIYTAAEKALGEIGEALVPAARGRIQAGALDPDSAESVLMLLSGLGSRSALELAQSQIDFFLEEVGAGVAAEWLALLGVQDLLEPLRKVLSRDTARVGQSVLLLAAIHSVRLPEDSIGRDRVLEKQGSEGRDDRARALRDVAPRCDSPAAVGWPQVSIQVPPVPRMQRRATMRPSLLRCASAAAPATGG